MVERGRFDQRDGRVGDGRAARGQALRAPPRPRPGRRRVARATTIGLSGPCSACASASSAISRAFAVGVGDDDELGRPREPVDADGAVELALRLGDPGVAGPGDHVDAVDRSRCPDRQGGDRPARRRSHRPRRPRRGARRQGRPARGVPSGRGRRDEDDPPDPGHSRRDQAHQDRRGIGGAPTGRVDAGARHGALEDRDTS